LVLTHAWALLNSSPEGVTGYLDADVHDPDRILAGAAKILDFAEPVALMMLGILGNVVNYDEARSILDRLVSALPPGSYVVVNDGTNVINPAARDEATRISIKAGTPYIARHPDEIAGFFHGLELVEPGVVSSSRWRPDATADSPPPAEVASIEMHLMPGYAPELNPVELLNGDIKRHVSQANPGTVAELTAAATAHLRRRQNQPNIVKALFRKPEVRYAAACQESGRSLIARRTHPAARHQKNLTALERATGWRYAITATNITRIWGIAVANASAGITIGAGPRTCATGHDSIDALTKMTSAIIATV